VTPPLAQSTALIDQAIALVDPAIPQERGILSVIRIFRQLSRRTEDSVIIVRSEGDPPMTSSWKSESGTLLCRWSEFGQRVQYNPTWMQAASDMRGAYLPPLPDFASHSPFAGASWFKAKAQSEMGLLRHNS